MEQETIRLTAPQKASSELEELSINTIRFLAVDAVEKAKSGHPGTPMEAAAMAYELWINIMHYNPANPDWPNRDRFVLSSGHASMLLYAMLHLTGYDLPMEELQRFRQIGSKTPGHPEYGHTPGVETTTGPLGQGFGAGVGMAIAERYLGGYFNRPGHSIIDYHIYAYCSDGDMMEGISSETASIAGHIKLNKLIYVYGDNHITIDGDTNKTFSEDVGKRFEGYHWFVQHIEGNDRAAFKHAIEEAQSQADKPSLIIARTHIGYGSPGKQDKASAHGAALGPDEVKRTKENLGWPLEPTFYIPEEVLRHFRQCVEKGRRSEEDWNRRFESYRKEYPELAETFQKWLHSELPENWQKAIPDLSAEKPMATRQASAKVFAALAEVLPNMIGGSADLVESTFIDFKNSGSIHETPTGRNLHFGIREHAMGAIENGIAVSKMLIPVGATFFVFSDYMKPAVRIAALMKANTIYVWTHDSIGLGEDGPTHQPIEHLAALRAMPGITLIRPADATETAIAWELAISLKKGPVGLILTRQKLPVIDRKKFASADGVRNGGYVLADTQQGNPELILIATGSEVSLAMEAWEKLSAEGIATRVVSLPCWEIFEQQSSEYRESVLPANIKNRLAIEAASPLGWERYIGEHGDMIGMTTFGASAPVDDVMKHFGFTPENVITRAKDLLKRNQK
ncbi:transketolase [bacterium]|nr:transketolase [bacterium]